MEAAAEGLDTRSGQDYPPAQRDQEPVSPGNTCCLPELGGKPAQGPQRHVVGGCVGGASGWVVGEEVVQEALNFFIFCPFCIVIVAIILISCTLFFLFVLFFLLFMLLLSLIIILVVVF